MCKNISTVPEFKKLIMHFKTLANSHQFERIEIGESPELEINNVCYLFLTKDIIEISFNDQLYTMQINGHNRLGIYRYLKVLVCLGPIWFYTITKEDGPYTYLRYEKKLKLIRELLL